MPARFTPLVTGQYYHVFNRGVNRQPIFQGLRDYKRALDILNYYSFNPKVRFSKFLLFSQEEKNNFMNSLHRLNDKLVDIVCFCLMPNHFHLLLNQLKDNGISKFMANLQNSLTRYFNTKHQRIGPLLQGQFKTVLIEDDNQLLHLSRYIHLNPYSSYVVKDQKSLSEYPWSSLPEYISIDVAKICNSEIILSQFKDKKSYKDFVFDQADYQRRLEEIKHLLLEKVLLRCPT